MARSKSSARSRPEKPTDGGSPAESAAGRPPRKRGRSGTPPDGGTSGKATARTSILEGDDGRRGRPPVKRPAEPDDGADLDELDDLGPDPELGLERRAAEASQPRVQLRVVEDPPDDDDDDDFDGDFDPALAPPPGYRPRT
ncbi:MAG: hypothetical protein AAFN30_08135 [Actinomycetota bacterium]